MTDILGNLITSFTIVVASAVVGYISCLIKMEHDIEKKGYITFNVKNGKKKGKLTWSEREQEKND